MRLAKYIADSGYCSRRKAEELILAGLVEIAGKTALISDSVNPDIDIVSVNGELLSAGSKIYIMLNKPAGYLSSCQPGREKGKSVLELVKIPQRVFPVGRLDRDSRGLLLLTNDGDLTFRLTHPSFEKEKEYIILTDSPFSENNLQLLEDGICLNNTNCRFHRIERLEMNRYRVILKQGVKRQIRLMAKAVGKKILDLQRVRIAGLELGDLPEGKWKYLSLNEINQLT